MNNLDRARSLAEYLKPWEVLRLVPRTRANLSLLVADAFKNLANDNVKFAELRNSVIYIAKNSNVSLTEAMQWLLDDISDQSTRYGVKAGLILTVSRSNTTKAELTELLQAYDDLGRPSQIVGVDIAGDEDVRIDYSIGKVLKRAKDKFGLGLTIHAGETGNIQNVVDAITLLHADRIGHGTAAGESVTVMQMLKERNVCVEVCPVSNMLTSAVKANRRHPVNQFIKNEVAFVLCSDNPAIHKKSLSDDYVSFFIENRNVEVLEDMYNRQLKYSFLST